MVSCQGRQVFKKQTRRYAFDMSKRHPNSATVAAWVDGLIYPDSRRQACFRAGIQQPTLTRQINEIGKLAPEVVIQLCRAYGRSPAQGLYENGYLEPSEAKQPDLDSILSSIPFSRLLEELQARGERAGLS